MDRFLLGSQGHTIQASHRARAGGGAITMSKGDFFSFITTLKPIELKAIGELSQVIHLAEGVTVYSSGDDSDALYIINRGVVEVIHENQRHTHHTAISYLGRGDVFGETDVLTETPRKNAIRTCEPVSVQCFNKAQFPELIRRVPRFFAYLCHQLAHQLVKISDLAFVQSNCLELSGNLANFDLVTIYQTILNSSQTGELSIVNDTGETAAVFTFEAGQPMQAQFYHLTGEEAFWQLFLHEKLAGTFAFSIVEAGPNFHRPDLGPVIKRHPTDLLLTALQARDEFKQLLDKVPEQAMALQRIRLNLSWDEPAGDDGLRELAETIWQTCYTATLTVEELFGQLGWCELKFYKVVIQLLRTGHFALVLPDEAQTAAAAAACAADHSTVPLRASPVGARY